MISYYDHGKYKLQLSKYFEMFGYQLKFSTICTGALGVSRKCLNQLNSFIYSIYELFSSYGWPMKGV